MKKLLGWLRGDVRTEQKPHVREVAPIVIAIAGASPFDLQANIQTENGFPLVNWKAVEDWISGIQLSESQAQAWTACERGWLLHLRDALGPGYYYEESASAAIVSSLDAKIAHKTLGFIDKTLKRILMVMGELASASPCARDILIVFNDVDTYYNYTSLYGPESGEFSLSAGTFISRGCSHFVTRKEELQAVEPTTVA